MRKRKLSPSEIVERLRVIEALTADGQPVANALLFAGVHEAEYDEWRSRYGGLMRTLGPLAAAPRVWKRPRR